MEVRKGGGGGEMGNFRYLLRSQSRERKTEREMREIRLKFDKKFRK